MFANISIQLNIWQLLHRQSTSIWIDKFPQFESRRRKRLFQPLFEMLTDNRTDLNTRLFRTVGYPLIKPNIWVNIWLDVQMIYESIFQRYIPSFPPRNGSRNWKDKPDLCLLIMFGICTFINIKLSKRSLFLNFIAQGKMTRRLNFYFCWKFITVI